MPCQNPSTTGSSFKAEAFETRGKKFIFLCILISLNVGATQNQTHQLNMGFLRVKVFWCTASSKEAHFNSD